MNQEEVARLLHVPDRSTISRWTKALLPKHQRGADYTQAEIKILAARAGVPYPAQSAQPVRAENTPLAHSEGQEMPFARADTSLHVQAPSE